MKIPITKPYIGKEEKKAICDVLDSGWLVQGAKVAEFEKMICMYTGAKYAVASTSCTTSLHLALEALGIGKGDEVIVPSFTFIASANAIEYTGAKPVFVDIDLDTYNINVEGIRRAITSKTKAIMPVHLFGLCADMNEIMMIAKKYGLFVVEDAACAWGSMIGTQHAGTFGDISSFSLHPRKPITTGEGGMAITNNPGLATKMRSLRDHGAAVSDLARHDKGDSILPAYEMRGYNFRMTDIQGAMGVEQMKKLPWIIQKRIEKAEIYNKELRDIDWLKVPWKPNNHKHTYQSYVVLVAGNELRNKVMVDLADKGISTRQGTHAVHALSYYKKKYHFTDSDLNCSFTADQLTMTIPLYPQMTSLEQEYVIDAIRRIK